MDQISQEIRVEQVRVELTRRLREAVLRPGFPPAMSVYPSDTLLDAQHFAAWLGNKIVGVASIHPEPLTGFENKRSWRLRGMAVDPSFQGTGIGKQILDECLKFIKQFDGEILWCNGRKTALKFYQSFGFNIIGEEFEVAESGPHFVMILPVENRKEKL